MLFSNASVNSGFYSSSSSLDVDYTDGLFAWSTRSWCTSLGSCRCLAISSRSFGVGSSMNVLLSSWLQLWLMLQLLLFWRAWLSISLAILLNHLRCSPCCLNLRDLLIDPSITLWLLGIHVLSLFGCTLINSWGYVSYWCHILPLLGSSFPHIVAWLGHWLVK